MELLKKIIIVMVISVAMFACSNGDDESGDHTGTPAVVPQIDPTATLHPLIAEKTPPPVNLSTPIPPLATREPFIPLLPPSDRPAVVSAIDDKPFRGHLSGTADITVQDEMIVVETEDGKTANVAYRLPPSLPSLPKGTFGGSIVMKEESTYATSYAATTVNDGIGLLFAEIYDSAATPMELIVGDDIRFSQQAISGPVSEGSLVVEVPAEIVTSSGTVDVKAGQTLEVESDNGHYHFYLEDSAYYESDKYSTDPFSGYRTHLWVVRSN